MRFPVSGGSVDVAHPRVPYTSRAVDTVLTVVANT